MTFSPNHTALTTTTSRLTTSRLTTSRKDA